MCRWPDALPRCLIETGGRPLPRAATRMNIDPYAYTPMPHTNHSSHCGMYIGTVCIVISPGYCDITAYVISLVYATYSDITTARPPQTAISRGVYTEVLCRRDHPPLTYSGLCKRETSADCKENRKSYNKTACFKAGRRSHRGNIRLANAFLCFPSASRCPARLCRQTPFCAT